MLNMLRLGNGHWINPAYVVNIKPRPNGCRLSVANGNYTEHYEIADLTADELAHQLAKPADVPPPPPRTHDTPSEPS